MGLMEYWEDVGMQFLSNWTEESEIRFVRVVVKEKEAAVKKMRKWLERNMK